MSTHEGTSMIKTTAFAAMLLLVPLTAHTTRTAHAALEPRVPGANGAKSEARPVVKPAVKTDADYPIFPDTPKNHWAYVAMEKLQRANLSFRYAGANRIPLPLPRTMTRYEVAVFTARALDKLATVAPAATLRLDQMSWQEIEREIIVRMWLAQFDSSLNALQTEFADELARLGVRVDSLGEPSQTPRKRTPWPSKKPPSAKSPSMGRSHPGALELGDK